MKKRPLPPAVPSAETMAIYSRILDLQPRKSDLRRKAILDAVIDCLTTEGIHNLSAFSIGKRTKMRRSHVVYYFPTLESMIEGAVKFAISVSQDFNLRYLSAAKSPSEQLKAYVEGTFAWLEENPKHAALLSLASYYSTFSPMYRELHAEVVRMSEERILAILQSAPAKAGLDRDAAVRISQNIRDLLVGCLNSLYGARQANEYGKARKRLFETVEMLARQYWK